MADEPQATNTESPAEPTPRGGKRWMTVLVVLLLMGGEAVAIFFLAKAISPAPAPAVAETGGDDGGLEGETSLDRYAEVELADCRPSNLMTGKLITFKIRVTGLVEKEDLERAQEMAEAKKARLEDRVNYVIRSAEPRHLAEPQLETIKRRLKHEFARVFGDDELIKEVLIPEFLQSGAGL